MANQYSPLCPPDDQANPRKRRSQVENLNPVSFSYSLSVPMVSNMSLNKPDIPTTSTSLLSFTNLLGEDQTTEIAEQSDEIADIIRENAEELQNKLREKWMNNFYAVERASELRVTKKMKEFEVEMESMKKEVMMAQKKVERLAFEKRIWEGKCRDLENEMSKMRASIFATKWGRTSQQQQQQQQRESSSESSSRSRVKRVACRVCGEYEAKDMMWACLHVCVCEECERFIDVCPICGGDKKNHHAGASAAAALP